MEALKQISDGSLDDVDLSGHVNIKVIVMMMILKRCTGRSEQIEQTLLPKLEIFSDKNCHKQIKEQVGFMEREIKQIFLVQ